MDLKKEYATDKKKETEGVWEDFGGGCKVLIARSGTDNYNKVFAKESKPHRKAWSRGTLSAEVQNRIMLKVLAKAVVLNWKGLKEDGKIVEYSFDECMRILKEYPDFRAQVEEVADSIEAYRLEDIEEAEKNSEASLNGTPATEKSSSGS